MLENKKNQPESAEDCEPKPKRVLVLDDDPIVREIAKLNLEELGYEPILMDDGLIEERFFARLRFDAAIIDLGLPGINGVDFIKRIRATSHGQHIPIFVVTSSTDSDQIRACYNDCNVSFVLTKPVDWKFLLQSLKESLAASFSQSHATCYAGG